LNGLNLMPNTPCRYCNFVNTVWFWNSSPPKPRRRWLALFLGVFFFFLVWLALAILFWPPSLDRWYEAWPVWPVAMLALVTHIAGIVLVIGACNRCIARVFGFPRLW